MLKLQLVCVLGAIVLVASVKVKVTKTDIGPIDELFAEHEIVPDVLDIAPKEWLNVGNF